jgi:hypothetical protein
MRAPTTVTFTGTVLRFLSVSVIVQVPAPTGVTLNCARYVELPAGFSAVVVLGRARGWSAEGSMG